MHGLIAGLCLVATIGTGDGAHVWTCEPPFVLESSEPELVTDIWATYEGHPYLFRWAIWPGPEHEWQIELEVFYRHEDPHTGLPYWTGYRIEVLLPTLSPWVGAPPMAEAPDDYGTYLAVEPGDWLCVAGRCSEVDGYLTAWSEECWETTCDSAALVAEIFDGVGGDAGTLARCAQWRQQPEG
jgi:hypothetical protein